MRFLILPVAFFSALFFSCFAYAEKTHRVGQKDKQFTEALLVIKEGDTVLFDNNDPFLHNVFSLSAGSIFDLGSYTEGESESITFDKAGEVVVECAIHPDMRMKIKVEE